MRASVVVNCFNQRDFIDSAVESVLRQVYPRCELEIIVVDNGSSDGTRARLETWKGELEIVDLPNSGQADAINAGVQRARGDVLCLLDGDDYFHPNHVSTAIELSRMSPLVYSNCDEVKVNRTRPLVPISKGLYRFPFAPTSCINIRTDVVHQLFPIPSKFTVSADMYICGAAYTRGIGSVFTADCLTAYRIHGANSYSGKPTPKRLGQRLAAFRAFEDFLLAEGKRVSADLPAAGRVQELLQNCRRSIKKNVLALERMAEHQKPLSLGGAAHQESWAERTLGYLVAACPPAALDEAAYFVRGLRLRACRRKFLADIKGI